MIYLPRRIWDTREIALGEAYYLLFQDERDVWVGARVLDDGWVVVAHKFDRPPTLEGFGDYLPEGSVELAPEDYRINWVNKDRMVVVRVVEGGEPGAKG